MTADSEKVTTESDKETAERDKSDKAAAGNDNK